MQRKDGEEMNQSKEVGGQWAIRALRNRKVMNKRYEWSLCNRGV